jgi:nitrogen fixation/metabolism regulation signal transduction histidine kinase
MNCRKFLKPPGSLLAFARKQTIAPRVLELKDTIDGMVEMLRRLIGEDIDFSWQAGHGLWSANIDPSKLDQLPATIFVNARNAIAEVGKITIETVEDKAAVLRMAGKMLKTLNSDLVNGG